MRLRDIIPVPAAADVHSRPSRRSWMNSLRASAKVALMCLAPLAVAPSAAYAAYPDKLIKIVVPFAPGGGTDTITRILAEQMSKDMGQSVIVDNRPGAGTIIGSNIVANSDPDGYTLLMATFAHAVNPSLNEKLPYDTAKAFAPVGLVAKSFNLAVVPSSSPFKSVADLIAYAKAHPSKLNYGSFGIGTSAHLAG